MTNNQLKAQEIKEQARSNRVREAQKDRELNQEDRKISDKRRETNINTATDLVGSGVKLVTGLNPLDFASRMYHARSDKSKGKGRNDPQWYNANPEITKQAANVSYNYGLGVRLDKDVVNKEGELGTGTSQPGIMRIQYTPVLPRIGDPSTVQNYVNSDQASTVDPAFWRAVQAIYVNTRHKNGGARNYTTPNMVQYLYALNSIYGLYSEIRRAISVLNNSVTLNKYYFRALAQSLGFDFNELADEVLDQTVRMNRLIKETNSMFMAPSVMPWFLRSMWLNSNFFLDNKDPIKSQLYVFVPTLYYKYGDTETELQAIANPTAYGPTSISVVNRNTAYEGIEIFGEVVRLKAMVDLFEELVSALLFSEDAGTIAGDLLKAYDESMMFKLPDIPLDQPVPVVYDELVLNQIMNIDIVGDLYYNDVDISDVYSIKEENDTLKQQLLTRGITYFVKNSITEEQFPVDANNPVASNWFYIMSSDNVQAVSKITIPANSSDEAELSNYPMYNIPTVYADREIQGAELLEVTRFKAVVSRTLPPLSKAEFEALTTENSLDRVVLCGTEIVNCAYVYQIQYNSASTSDNPDIVVYKVTNVNVYQDSTPASEVMYDYGMSMVTAANALHSVWHQFKSAPMLPTDTLIVMKFNETAPSTNGIVSTYILVRDNNINVDAPYVAVLGLSALKNLHSVSVLSLFGVK